MKQDNIQDSTRYIVSELHHGNVMPGNRSETLRDVYILSNAKIVGGIFAHELIIDGTNITVEKSVYAAKSLLIKNSSNNKNKKPIVFKSVVSASESLLVDCEQVKLKFFSDIYSKRINIKNAIIFGNIFVDDAIINNSIILGGIYCKNKLEISNSIYSTFRTGEVELGENLFQLFPIALAENPILINSPIKIITFLNILKPGSKDSGIVELNGDDIFEVSNPPLPSDSKPEENNERIYCLSLAERILNSHKIIQHFQFNKKLVEALALNSHLDNAYINENFKNSLEHLETYLWNILNGKKILTNIEGMESLNDIITKVMEKEKN